jgi:radical SAM protein with 4Fe4S-binding SPASM domain
MADAAAQSAVRPLIVSWNLTRLCNLACGHCYLDAAQRRREAHDELSTAEALAVVGEVAAVAPGAMLVLTGGEPLLRRDLAALVAAAAATGLMPVVGTNGTLLDDAAAARLRDAGAAGAGISLDSATHAFHDRLRGRRGAWDDALRGMRAARAAGLPLLVQTTLFDENRTELETIAAIAEAEGALALNLFFLVCTGRGARQTDLSPASYEASLAEIIALQRRRPGLIVRARCAPYLRRVLGLHANERGGNYAEWSSACLAGRRYFRITPQGKVTPCPYIPEVVGDLRAERLGDIWSGSPTLARLRAETPGGKCGQCDFRYSCGGCRARALASGGDLMAEDPKCIYLKPAALPAEPAPERLRRFRRERPEVAPRSGPVQSGTASTGGARSGRAVERFSASERAAPAVAWDERAARMLERIPGFVRARVRMKLEQAACEEGVPVITMDFIHRHRPPAAMLERLRSAGAEGGSAA